MYHFNLVQKGDTTNLTIFVNGGMLVADESHPNINEILAAVPQFRSGDIEPDEVEALFDASHRAAAKFENLSERVTVANSRVYVDGDEVTDVYARQIITFLNEGVDDWEPLVRFLEKVYTNIEAHTRENLARWLNACGSFTIDSDGDIIGYKGLTKESGSIHRGPGVVNGVAQNGSLENKPGNVIEMARSSVEHNPAIGCAAGLHVGTWDYARSFGNGVVVKVKVNPRDVVSVPTDCNGQKMRVFRYKVVSYVDQAHNEVSVPNDFVPSEDYLDGYDDGYDDADNGLEPRY